MNLDSRRRTLRALSGAATAWASVAAAQTVQVSPSALVGVSTTTHPVVEPYVAVDPSNPARLVAAAFFGADPKLRFPEGQDAETCAAFVSADSGATWTRHKFGTTWCADPWVAFTPAGDVLVTMVGRHPAFPSQGGSGLVGYHSPDGGATWDSLPIGLGRGHDHPTMAVDLTNGPRRGWIYLSSHRGRSADEGHYRYGVYIARSRNGGRAFDEPVTLLPNNLHNLTEMPVVLSDGTLVESYVDAAFTPDTGGPSPGGREQLFARRRAWVVRSTDGGFTFSIPMFVTDACGPPPGYRLSAFAADASGGAFDGRLYFACREAGGGPIVVAHSRDRGETWSAPVRMPATARDTATNPIPALAVDDRGVVLTAWTGASGAADDPCPTNLYVAASRDGGVTFSGRSLVAPCAGGGDYFGLTAIRGGRFRLLWPEDRRGVRQLRTAIVSVSP